MDTLHAIKELAAKEFGVELAAIDENAPVDTLGIDSLGFLEFMFQVEDHFDLSVPQDNVASVRTLADLATVVDTLIAAKASGVATGSPGSPAGAPGAPASGSPPA